MVPDLWWFNLHFSTLWWCESNMCSLESFLQILNLYCNDILFYCSHGSIFGHQELFSWLHKFMLMVPNLIHYNMDYANLFLCISTTSHFSCENHGYQHHSNFLNFSVLVSVLYPSQDIWSCQNIHWDIWSMSHSIIQTLTSLKCFLSFFDL